MAIPKRSKEMIASLIRYFEQERDNGGPLLPLNGVTDRVASALNVPNSGWRKAEIQNWLQERNIQYPREAIKVTLLKIVARNKPSKVYAADQMALKHGQRVLRLPPYHCIFYPIEKIWGIAKQYYNKHIGSDGCGMVKCLEMWQKALDMGTPQMCENTVEDTNKIISEWWTREIGFDRDDVAPLTIHLAPPGESSDEN